MNERLSPSAKQDVFSIFPVFPDLEQLGIAKPVFTKSGSVEVRKKSPGIRTNVSAVEVLYPYFLSKANLIKGALEERSSDESIQSSVIIGTHLHRIDSLLSVILQGETGTSVSRVFPTLKPGKERDAFFYATDGIDLDPRAGRDEMTSVMLGAARKFRNFYLENVSGNTWQESFLYSTRSQPALENAILTDKEVEREEELLISAWVKEAFFPRASYLPRSGS